MAVTGGYDFLKATNVAYTPGTIPYWDDTNNVVTATATGNKLIGKVTLVAGTTDTEVRVRMTQKKGTGRNSHQSPLVEMRVACGHTSVVH